jgi:predicted ATP-grasp superfamily ATP-dependent carboligase
VSGLGVARNLGRAGIVVHRLGATHEPILQSRYIHSTRVVLDLDQLDDEEYLAVLEEVRREIGGRPVLFPITDLHVLRHARLGPERLEGFHSTAPARDAAELLVNKGRFYEKLEALGIPHPLTRHPQTLAEFEAAALEIGYPVYVKPEISPQFHHAFHRKGFVARDQEELRSTVHVGTAGGASGNRTGRRQVHVRRRRLSARGWRSGVGLLSAGARVPDRVRLRLGDRNLRKLRS